MYFEAVMLLHSNVIKRIQIVSKVLSRDLLSTKLKFLVPLSIYTTQTLISINVHISISLDAMKLLL